MQYSAAFSQLVKYSQYWSISTHPM